MKSRLLIEFYPTGQRNVLLLPSVIVLFASSVPVSPIDSNFHTTNLKSLWLPSCLVRLAFVACIPAVLPLLQPLPTEACAGQQRHRTRPARPTWSVFPQVYSLDGHGASKRPGEKPSRKKVQRASQDADWCIVSPSRRQLFHQPAAHAGHALCPSGIGSLSSGLARMPIVLT